MNTIAKAMLQKFRKELIALILISAVVNILMLVPTIYMFQIFDRVMVSKNEITLVTVSIIILLLYGVQAVGEWARARITNAVSIRIDQALSPPIFQALFSERLKSSNQSPFQAFSDLAAIRQWMTGAGLNGFLDGPWTPFYLAVMFMLHPFLGWLAVGFLVLLIVLAVLTTRFSKSLSDATLEEERELNSFLYSKLRNAEVLEAHGMVPNLKRRWWARQADFYSNQARTEEVEERMTVTTKQIRYLLNSLAIAAGALLAIEGEITMAAMIGAGLIMGRTTAPVDAIMGGWRGFHLATSALTRLEALLKDNPSWEVNGTPPQFDGPIRLKNLTAFASPLGAQDSRRKILDSINLDIPEASITVIIGPSGAGKSTLGKVLTGIWPSQEGEVWIGSQNINDIDRNLYGQAIGYLPQEVDLFKGTVAMNIARLGEPDPERVIRAAHAVGIHPFVLKLTQGYDTVVGEQGGYLSGGQRQRLALARALYGDPRLLILDEPNASLDEEGERALLLALLAARKLGSTVVLISHRPNVIQIADHVVVMRGGSVAFSGSKSKFQLELHRLSPPTPERPST